MFIFKKKNHSWNRKTHLFGILGLDIGCEHHPNDLGQRKKMRSVPTLFSHMTGNPNLVDSFNTFEKYWSAGISISNRTKIRNVPKQQPAMIDFTLDPLWSLLICMQNMPGFSDVPMLDDQLVYIGAAGGC